MAILPFFYLLLGLVFATPSLSTRLFIEHELKANPAFLQFVSMSVTIPWIVKPIYGLVADSVPIWGYRKKSYIMIFSVISALGWIILAAAPASSITTFLCMLLSSFGLVVCDVVVDSLLVVLAQYEEGKEIGNIQSNTTAMRSVGYLLGALLSFFFLRSSHEHGPNRVPPRIFFYFTAIATFFIFIFAFFIHDVKVSQGDTNGIMRDKISTVRRCFNNESIWKPALFIFLFGATPSSSSAFFYFLNEPVEKGGLGFSAHFLAALSIFASSSSILGAWCFRCFLKKKSIRSVLIGTTVLGAFCSSLQLVIITRANLDLGIPDKFFAIGDDVLLAALSRIAFLPILILAARITPKGVEATVYASLISVSNFSEVISSGLGSALTAMLGIERDFVSDKIDFSNLTVLCFICSFSTLLPLFFINLVPNSVNTDDKVEYSVIKNPTTHEEKLDNVETSTI